MTDLRFLKIYKRQYDGNDRMHIPEEIQFPCGLRLLDWEAYPSKCLPPTFNPQYLVELSMKNSKLAKLWEGIKKLWVSGCINLQVIPARMNLASLDEVFMRGCSRLKNIPVMSTNIRKLCISETAVEDVPASTTLWTRLTSLSINKGGKLKRLTYLPKNVTDLDLSYSDIQKISDSIKALHQLRNLNLAGCTRLASLPKLPGSVKTIIAEDCESLETVSSSLNNPNARLNFINCFKLSQQARRAIFKQSFFTGGALLPGTEVPEEFDHRGRGTSLTIRPDGNPYSGFVVCVVISPKQQEFSFSQLKCRRIGVAQDDFYPVEMLVYVGEVHKFRREHLFVFDSRFLEFYPSDMSREIVLELSSNSNDFNIIDCGARILTDENGSDECGLDDQVLEDETELGPAEAFEYGLEHTNEAVCYSEEVDGGKRTDCWS
ncbi:hypothetical protein YC2023_114798 [Brassica napus]